MLSMGFHTVSGPSIQATKSRSAVWPSHGLLAAEVCAVYAFALSWFVKGWELVEYSRENRNSWPTPMSESDSLPAVR